jgi:hypothetical protein
MNFERIKGLIILLVVGAIPGLFIFFHVKEFLKNRQERIERQRIETELHSFAKKYNALDLEALYEDNLPKDKVFFKNLTVEKQQAMAKIRRQITTRPLLFKGMIENIIQDGEHHLLIMKNGFLAMPFRATLSCPKNYVERILLHRKSYLETFAVIAKISLLDEELPTEDSSFRFIFKGECIDIMYCGDY